MQYTEGSWFSTFYQLCDIDVTEETSTKKHCFGEFSLKKNLLRGIIEKGFVTPSSIQKSAVSKFLDGDDVVAVIKERITRIVTYSIPCLEKVNVNLEVIQG